jgi:hypothetical protein
MIPSGFFRVEKEGRVAPAVLVGLIVGGALAQHFRALVLFPSSLISALIVAFASLLVPQGTGALLLEALAITLALQVGYFVGLLAERVATGPRRLRANATRAGW